MHGRTGSSARPLARPMVCDSGLAREGIALFRALPGVRRPGNVLLCTDLHAENVLSAEREPWLMIDPKPYVGDPTYDALQHLLNCYERLEADPLALVRRMADLLELDRERLLAVAVRPLCPGVVRLAGACPARISHRSGLIAARGIAAGGRLVRSCDSTSGTGRTNRERNDDGRT